MKTIILAAGRGSRMQDLTSDRPKCLIKLRGETLLDGQLRSLRDAGVDEIGIVSGYKSELLRGRGLVEFHNARWADTNMVSSLACAADWLESYPCVVAYSDIFYEPRAVRSLMNCPASLAVCYDPNWKTLWEKRFSDPLVDAESFRLKDDGTLAEIGRKPKSIDRIEGQYMGLLRFEPEGWAELSRVWSALPDLQRDRCHMTGALQLVLDAGRLKIAAIPYCGQWGEVDSADDLLAYST